jgi:hypothetical protein
MDTDPTPKRLSGFQRRKLRVEAGLPRYTEREAAGRRASNSRRDQAKYPERRAEVARIKLERGCADCGYRAHPAALEFDHLPGTQKVAGVALLATRHNRRRLYEEIAKCEVVCANCHRIRTADRRSKT